MNNFMSRLITLSFKKEIWCKVKFVLVVKTYVFPRLSIVTIDFHSTGIQMLTLLIPVLINFLIDAAKLRQVSKQTRQLHEQSLQWLMRIGPKYPQEFKTMMSQSPDLRLRLETAVRNNQQSTNNSNKAAHDAQNASKAMGSSQQKPTIKLKTDFSNFS